MQVQAIKTRIFQEGEDLISFILEHVPELADGAILVVTSKIVALAEQRTEIASTPEFKEQIIKRESEIALRTKYVWLTVTDGMLMASAGIDESNADGKLILLPEDSYHTSEILRHQLLKKYQINNLGIIITDSRTTPFRAGVTGVALGYAGFNGIKDYRGTKDIYGREFKFSQTNIADSLATAAVLEMGEGSEQQPLAVITGTKVEFAETIDRTEVVIPMEDDMYLPLLPKMEK